MAEAKTYRALQTLYVDERFIREGELFTTDAQAGTQWELVDDGKEKTSKPRAPKPDADE